MKVKEIPVERLLELMKEGQKVHVIYYAYGVYWGTSADSGTTAQELLDNMRYDCLKARVFGITDKDGTIIIEGVLAE